MNTTARATDDTPSLDRAVFSASTELVERGVLQPTCLFLLRTGVGILPGRLENGQRLPLERVEGLPAVWREAVLHHGHFNGLATWMLEDAGELPPPGSPPWAAAFPVWLAAAAGASSLVVTCASSALTPDDGSAGSAAAALPIGTMALLSDHLNLSGTSPLLGLGESRLGPRFPDQTTLHDHALRRAALRACERLGLSAVEAVAACSLGPALETPAERRWFARAGAQLSVQDLASPLVAAAHAGLGALTLAIITHAGEGELDIAGIAAASRALAPAVDDLLWELASEVARESEALLGEEPG